jgi:hypothetical protein
MSREPMQIAALAVYSENIAVNYIDVNKAGVHF